MSGGHFDNAQYHIEEIAYTLEGLIRDNGSQELNKWGEPKHRNYPPHIIKEFKRAVNLLWTAHVYAQRIDYLVSGDDGEESFVKRLAADLANLTPYEQEPAT